MTARGSSSGLPGEGRDHLLEGAKGHAPSSGTLFLGEVSAACVVPRIVGFQSLGYAQKIAPRPHLQWEAPVVPRSKYFWSSPGGQIARIDAADSGGTELDRVERVIHRVGHHQRITRNALQRLDSGACQRNDLDLKAARGGEDFLVTQITAKRREDFTGEKMVRTERRQLRPLYQGRAEPRFFFSSRRLHTR